MKENNAEDFTKIFIDRIITNDKLDEEFELKTLNVRFEIEYDKQNDDIRNFAEYLMDFDDNKNSFYFIYTYDFNIKNFEKNLNIEFDKLKMRGNKLNNGQRLSQEKKNENKLIKEVLGEMLLKIYINSLTESTYYSDENYENKSKIDNMKFRSLFNIKSIKAGRKLDDGSDNTQKTLSKSVVSLASSDKEWNEKTKDLPSRVLSEIEKTDVKDVIRKASVETLETTVKSLSETNGGNTGDILLDLDVRVEDVDDFIKKVTSIKYVL